MAKAILCDRCGAVYKNKDDVKHQFVVFDVTEKNSNSWSPEYRAGRTLDFCEDCYQDLANLINNPPVR